MPVIQMIYNKGKKQQLSRSVCVKYTHAGTKTHTSRKMTGEKSRFALSKTGRTLRRRFVLNQPVKRIISS